MAEFITKELSKSVKEANQFADIFARGKMVIVDFPNKELAKTTLERLNQNISHMIWQ